MHVKLLLIAAILALIAEVAKAQIPDTSIDRALARPEFTWRSIADDDVRLFYQPGSFAERHRIMLLRGAQAALASGRAFLDMEADERELRVIYVDDRAEMEKLIGWTYAGYADWTGHGVFLVCNPEWRSFDTHEICHVLSFGRWGDPTESSTWMIEGLPNAVDGWCQTYDIDSIAGYLTATGIWPGLSEFTAGDRTLGEIEAGVLAASLLRFLRQLYGPAVLEEIWRTGIVETFELREIDLARIEEEWLESLRDLPDSLTDSEWQKMDADGCG